MRTVLGIILCVGLTGCQALRVDPGCDGASVVSLRLGTLHHDHEEGKAAQHDDNGTGMREPAYEAYLTTQPPQGMTPSSGPSHAIQALIPGPNGPSMAYLEFQDGMQSQPPMVQTASNAPASSDAAVRAIQTEVTQQICQQVIDLKQQVQDLTSQVKTRPDPAAVETIAANVAALNRQVSKLNEGLNSLKATQEQRSASAAPSTAAPQEAPVQPAAAPAPSPIHQASAQSLQPPAPITATEPIDLTQKEVNMLVTQCVFELKSEIRDLNLRLTKIPGAAKSGD